MSEGDKENRPANTLTQHSICLLTSEIATISPGHAKSLVFDHMQLAVKQIF